MINLYSRKHAVAKSLECNTEMTSVKLSVKIKMHRIRPLLGLVPVHFYAAKLQR